ncbi:hypothetical protein [Crocosphaera subtropica]|nr:hypothetical protein [Crocosphaera subtropica]
MKVYTAYIVTEEGVKEDDHYVYQNKEKAKEAAQAWGLLEKAKHCGIKEKRYIPN